VPPGQRPGTLNDLLTLKFFADGESQSEEGVYKETEHVPIPSLDSVPRRRWPAIILFCVFVGAAAGSAWWMGLRPPAEWQSSRAWQALHLPKLPPPHG